MLSDKVACQFIAVIIDPYYSHATINLPEDTVL